MQHHEVAQLDGNQRFHWWRWLAFWNFNNKGPKLAISWWIAWTFFYGSALFTLGSAAALVHKVCVALSALPLLSLIHLFIQFFCHSFVPLFLLVFILSFTHPFLLSSIHPFPLVACLLCVVSLGFHGRLVSAPSYIEIPCLPFLSCSALCIFTTAMRYTVVTYQHFA